jgi:hypothetical protein
MSTPTLAPIRLTRQTSLYAYTAPDLPIHAGFNQTSGWIEIRLTDNEVVTVFLTPEQMETLGASLMATADRWRATTPVPEAV